MKILYTTLFLCLSLATLAQHHASEKYFRHLRYNHVSPQIPIVGVHEISAQEAQQTSHYIFKYNSEQQLSEIINNHYHSEKRHPLTTLGAYRTSITYTDSTESRMYFDKNDKRIVNDRQVYLEVHHFDKKGFKRLLKFYDLEGEPMESDWKVAYYQWEKNKKLVIERRFNLNNEPVNISPYFEFGVTGIRYNKKGLPKACFNLDENLNPKNNAVGIATYKDTYAKNGDHIQYAYYNQDDQLVKNQWGFALAVKGYDTNGNFITTTRYNENNELIVTYPRPSNVNIKLADPVSQKDSLEIRNKSLGYLIALQELKPKLMSEVFHQDLAKRTIGFDRGAKRENIRETTYEQMIKFAESWNKAGNKFPPKPNNQVTILDIYQKIATVKLVSDNWVEYLHLVKTNNEWKIINLLWQHKDSTRYPK